MAGFNPITEGCGGTLVNEAGTGTLVASPSTVTFGSVPIGQTAGTTVSLLNQGSAPVQIAQVNLSGQPFSLVAPGNLPVTVAAGGTYSLNLQFNPAAPGAATGQLTLASDSSTKHLPVITLRGTGTAGIGSAALSGLYCSSGAMTGSGTEACTLTLTAAAPGGGLVVNLSSSSSAVTVPSTVTVPANATSAEFTATVSSVATTQAVTITASAGTVLKNFTLELSAAILALSLNATSVAFGDVVVSTSATQSVTLTSSGTVPVTLTGASLTGTGFTLSGPTFPVTLNLGQTAVLEVGFNPIAPGLASGQLRIISNSSSGATAVIGLTGTGMEPSQVVDVAVTPATVSVTTSGTQQFAASVTGTSNTDVTWTVSGVGCSGATCGTISSTGLYKAPATSPAATMVTSTATSVSDPSKSASAIIEVLQPPSIQVPAPTVSLLPAIFAPGITVGLADTNLAAVICYTTDGTNPALSPAGACDIGTMAYSEPIALTATTTITAIAVLPGTNEISNSVSATYTIQAGSNNIKSDQSLTLGGAQTAITTAGATTTSLVRAQSGGQTLWQLLPNPWGASTLYSGNTSVAYSGTGTITTTVAMGNLPNAAVNGYPLVFYGGDVWGDHIGDDTVVFPALLSQMGSLLVNVNYALNNTGAPANQDIAFDEWLIPSSTFSGGMPGAVEVIVCPYYKFSDGPLGPLVGTFTDTVLFDGVITSLQFNEYLAGHGAGAHVLFAPTTTQLHSAGLQLNLLNFLQQGASLSGVSGWYVAGFDYGTEYGESSTASYTLTTTKLGISQMLRPASN